MRLKAVKLPGPDADGDVLHLGPPVRDELGPAVGLVRAVVAQLDLGFQNPTRRSY